MEDITKIIDGVFLHGKLTPDKSYDLPEGQYTVQEAIDKIQSHTRGVQDNVIKEVSGTGGIEGHFCDWNNPKVWAKDIPPSPKEVQDFALTLIKKAFGYELATPEEQL